SKSDMVGYFAFEGTFDDQSNNEQRSQPSDGLSFEKGKCGEAVWFEEKNEVRVTVPHAAVLDTPNEFTISVWVYPTLYRTDTANSHILISQWFTSSQNGNYILRLGAGEQAGLLSLTVANTEGSTFNSDYVIAPDDHKVPLNAWSHVAASFDRG